MGLKSTEKGMKSVLGTDLGRKARAWAPEQVAKRQTEQMLAQLQLARRNLPQ